MDELEVTLELQKRLKNLGYYVGAFPTPIEINGEKFRAYIFAGEDNRSLIVIDPGKPLTSDTIDGIIGE